MLNKKLLVDVVNALIKEPDIHDQGVWAKGNLTDDYVRGWRVVSCGTAQCVAGEACLMMGDTFVVHEGDFIAQGKVLIQADYVVRVDNSHVESVRNRAQDLLGLTCDQADALFEYDNSLADIREMARMLIDGEPFDLYSRPRLGDVGVDLLPEVV